MPLVPLAQVSPSAGEPPSFVTAAALGGLIVLIVCAPFLIWRRTRRWAAFALLVLWIGQAALLTSPGILAAYFQYGSEVLPWLLVLCADAVVFAPLLLWRRTRRLGLVLVGLGVIGAVAFMDYLGLVITSIGYLLLLLALWPRWRLLQGAPRGRETRPAPPSRGVLTVRPWPVDARPTERGFSLVSSLVGVTCLVVAFVLAAQVVGGTTSALRRANRLAIATDLLESARERMLAGADPGDVAAAAAALLPHGEASMQRAPTGPGLVRMTGAVTWQEPHGKPGRAVLEWLAVEGPR